MSIAAIIPAAGNSGRMGRQKALLSFGNGMNFAAYLVGFLEAYGCDPVVLVVNDEFDLARLPKISHPPVINNMVSLGRFFSIQLGLQQIPKGSSCFIHNVDNPFLEKDLLDRMISAAAEDHFVVPVYQGQAGHPVLLGSKVVAGMLQKDPAGNFREILSGFTRVDVPCSDDRILWNINTPDDYTAFLRRGGE
ncbi:MAG: NTP transferase domain-containing protein [Bacteroidota bacterium]